MVRVGGKERGLVREERFGVKWGVMGWKLRGMSLVSDVFQLWENGRCGINTKYSGERGFLNGGF